MIDVSSATQITNIGANDVLSNHHKIIRDDTMLQESVISDNSEEVFRLRRVHKKVKDQQRLLQKLHTRQRHHNDESKPVLSM